ncbi:type II secretion system protein [Bacillus sp. B15-48]|uniref:type IV pilus modification PilV family protein n=1 Tax=Bacillus sp. B15-48 TaxID=1548601 RepID=UPI00193F3DBA|nr:type II secretion system protein [Bacillus sp. B15-48]MBM4762453.1 prepilin-type N-terminal cleavage/methylation domain-containing protein [Bacillus sp. B15-48]
MNKKGFTLVEVLTAIVILSIITVSLLSMFIQSSRSTRLSENILDATYVAQSHMEELIHVNKSSQPGSLIEFAELLTEKEGYFPDSDCSQCYGKTTPQDERYILVQVSHYSTNLGKLVVKVFNNDTKARQEAQMETLLQWNQR